MIRKISLLAMLTAVFTMAASAFTLDAVGYAGDELSPDPVAINVPGYGEFLLEASFGSVIVINSAYRNDDEHDEVSLAFDESHATRIVLNQKDSEDPSQAGLQVSDHAPISHSTKQNPDAVPESASAVLGLIGIAIFILLRRR